ncbi:MAG: hypothetical protein DHS20C18_33200 [Saprospiraceae bacterium]|nr:MAG: hypothetical protein DHS20C18_33200 [Saprospiraceae bacterium]
MRTIFLAFILINISQFALLAQPRFVNEDYKDFYEWFHQRAQTEKLYTDGSALYIFGQSSPVYSHPTLNSSVLLSLPIGKEVTNIGYKAYQYPEDEIGGYGDIWYQVKGVSDSGKTFKGFVWGGNIAKSWTFSDLNGDNKNELIMLGISSQKRKNLQDIKADIKIISAGKLMAQTTVPGLCVFEDCTASALIRVLKDQPYPGIFIFEASTMTIGCYAGIEKAFYFWNGQQLETVFHAEYTISKIYDNQAFVYRPQGNDQTMICRYDHEDKYYNPVWKCQPIAAKNVEPNKNIKAAFAAKGRAKAR